MPSFCKRTIQLALWLIGLLGTAALLLLAFAMLTEYRPAPYETIYPDPGASCDTLSNSTHQSLFPTHTHTTAISADSTAHESTFSTFLSPDSSTTSPVNPDTLTLLTWNIGYAGLGAEMDFFYDGGTRMRTSYAHTKDNLHGIIHTIDSLDADIILLQEVDTTSRRTYRINELDTLRHHFPEYYIYFAANYHVRYVPLPLTNPTGRVTAGLVIMSRLKPEKVLRVGYKAQLGWPIRLFELKRCFMAASYQLPNGQPLVVVNTHNSAYGKGDIRTAQTKELARYLQGCQSAGYSSVTGGDWNQYPPGYTPTTAELSDPDFQPMPVADTLFDRSWQWASDLTTPSLRYLNQPYDSTVSTRTITDFFLLSPGIELLSVHTEPLSFANSDHNPVAIRIVVH